MDTYRTEILDQPAALRRMAAYYVTGEGQSLLERLPRREGLLLTGMGASYHAAWAASLHAQSLNLRATVVEATDLIYYSSTLAAPDSTLIYLSQSGESAEVSPIVERLPLDVSRIAITNAPDSLLARHANIVLPVMAGTETLVASKTYVNSLAVLWLMIRRWAGVEPTIGDLLSAADTIERLLASWEAITAQWLDSLGDVPSLVFLGHGPHAATARQAAMMVNEWAKVPAQSASIGAFQHGFVECAGSNIGAVIFAPPGRSTESALRLAERLDTYGARVLLVSNGETKQLGESQPSESTDEFLSPLLDIIPVQMFAEALAGQRQIPRGFRYLSKVVTKL